MSIHVTNASSAILWPIFQLKWRHLVAKFGTNASGATISWRDNSSLGAIPWVRCASGNVLFVGCARGCFWIKEKLILVKEFLSGKSRMSLWRKIKQQRHSQAIITKLSSAAVECHGKKTETIKKTQKHLKLSLDLTNKEIKTRPFRKHPNRATCGFLQLRGNLAKPFLK